MIETTCALALYTTSKLLIVHPTNGRHGGGWSLPKGLLGHGEIPAVAALRELQEETGIFIRDGHAFIGDHQVSVTGALTDHGCHVYRPKVKNLHLFSLQISDVLNQELLICESTFGNPPQPEIDNFSWVAFKPAQLLLNARQLELILEHTEVFK